MLKSCANIGIKINQKEEKTNMCKAIQELQQEAVEEAVAEATKNFSKAVKSLMANMNLTFEQAVSALSLSESERAVLKPMLQTQ